MALRIVEATVSPQSTTVGQPVLVVVKISEGNWKAVKETYADWQALKDALIDWESVKNT